MPRWEPNARLRLLEAALELFEQQGYDDTAVAEIAERAGLTKTTFFRQFADKREVLFAGGEAHREILATATAGAPGDATPLEAVRAALEALAGDYPPDRRAFAARVLAITAGHPDLRERGTLKQAGYAESLAGALRARGVEDATATVAADLGVMAYMLAFGRWAREERPGSLVELTRAALDELRAATAALG